MVDSRESQILRGLHVSVAAASKQGKLSPSPISTCLATGSKSVPSSLSEPSSLLLNQV